jgi:hypothetical protein
VDVIQRVGTRIRGKPVDVPGKQDTQEKTPTKPSTAHTQSLLAYVYVSLPAIKSLAVHYIASPELLVHREGRLPFPVAPLAVRYDFGQLDPFFRNAGNLPVVLAHVITGLDPENGPVRSGYQPPNALLLLQGTDHPDAVQGKAFKFFLAPQLVGFDPATGNRLDIRGTAYRRSKRISAIARLVDLGFDLFDLRQGFDAPLLPSLDVGQVIAQILHVIAHTACKRNAQEKQGQRP